MKLKRRGVAKTRYQEFMAIVQAVRKDKAKFIRRLQGLLRVDGDCLRYMGAHTKDGYGRLTLRYRGANGSGKEARRETRKMSIYVHRLFLILTIARPIKLDHDAGHGEGCPYRDCVLHVFEQHYALNCNTNGAGRSGDPDNVPLLKGVKHEP